MRRHILKAFAVSIAASALIATDASAQGQGQGPIYNVPPPPPGLVKFPAKLQVLRAGSQGRKLDVLASLTSRASGSVRVTYRSNGTTTRFTVPISSTTRNLKFKKTLSAKAGKLPTGILTFTYAGDGDTYGDSVRLRAGNTKAKLRREVAELDDNGNLKVSGTISDRARGIVRIRLDTPYSSTGPTRSLFFRAKINDGTWSIDTLLPEGAREGGELSIQFTGFFPRRMRGEQDAKQVLPDN